MSDRVKRDSIYRLVGRTVTIKAGAPAIVGHKGIVDAVCDNESEVLVVVEGSPNSTFGAWVCRPDQLGLGPANLYTPT